jgi:YggT family protein
VRILCTALTLAQLAIVAWIILFYVVELGRVPWDHPVRKVYDALARAIEPVLRPIRRVIPPLRLGGAALDLAPLILIIGLQILQSIIC